MDNRPFDRISRALTGTTSRRQALKLLGGSLAGSVVIGGGIEWAAAGPDLPQDFVPFFGSSPPEDVRRHHWNTLTSGTYKIRQLSSGRYVDAWVEAAQDYRVVTRDFQDNDTQRWIAVPEHLGDTAGGWDYTIRQLSTVRFVGAYGADEDFRLATRNFHANNTQLWKFTQSGGDGIYRIQHPSDGRFVDAYVGEEDFGLVTRPFQDDDSQRWVCESVGAVWGIYHKSTGRYIDAYEDAGQDFRLVTRPHDDSGIGRISDPQSWIVVPIGDGVYRIRQLSTGQFVDAHEYDDMDFGLVTRPYQDNDTQRWLFERESDS